MVYDKFKLRVRGLGKSLVEVAEEFGISREGLYQWKAHGVPRYAEYWLLWREGERKDYEEVKRRLRLFVDGLS